MIILRVLIKFHYKNPVSRDRKTIFATMKLIVLCAVALGIVSCAHYSDLAVKGALGNPGQLLSLYQEFADNEGKVKSSQRLTLFKSSLKRISEGNARHPTWTQGLNKFADMTPEEKRGYLGLNITSLHKKRLFQVADRSDIPACKDWSAEGKVTGVKDQGDCGSCWSFGAVGPIETNYAIRTGKLKSFAEKEYLDCVYKSNGCNGGFYESGWKYSRKRGRLALTRDAPYVARDGRCGKNYRKMHDGLIAQKITGYTTVPPGEDKVISWLAEGAVGIAFEVTDDFMLYQKGIVEDKSCKCGNTGCGKWGSANHAVTAVGYTPKSMILKNSWGTAWGMKGYWETARGTDKCEYFRWGAVPTWRKTGKKDNDPEYVPTEDEDCEGTNADGCACGTVRCGDGVCRHAHMC